MPTTENKDIARRFYDLVWIKRDMAAAEPLIAPNCIRHDPSGPVPTGPAGFAAMAQKWRAAFSDLSLHRFHAGRRRSRRRSLDHRRHPYRPLRRRSRLRHVREILRRQHLPHRPGRIAEIWNHRDDLAVYQQIGAVS